MFFQGELPDGVELDLKDDRATGGADSLGLAEEVVDLKHPVRRVAIHGLEGSVLERQALVVVVVDEFVVETQPGGLGQQGGLDVGAAVHSDARAPGDGRVVVFVDVVEDVGVFGVCKIEIGDGAEHVEIGRKASSGVQKAEHTIAATEVHAGCDNRNAAEGVTSQDHPKRVFRAQPVSVDEAAVLLFG